MSITKEFKAFIMRGNVIDMAVGVVIGAAFKAIVDALVNNIIMPGIGFLLAGIDFSDIQTVLRAAEGDQPSVAIQWGLFIQAIINFLIIALVIFFAVKAINSMRERFDRMRGIEEAEEAPAGPSEAELLSEILDELRRQNDGTPVQG